MVAKVELKKLKELTKKLKGQPKGKPPLKEVKNILKKLEIYKKEK